MNVIATNATIEKEINFVWLSERKIFVYEKRGVELVTIHFNKDNDVSKILINKEFDELDLDEKTNIIIDIKVEVGLEKGFDMKFLNPQPNVKKALSEKLIEKNVLDWVISRMGIKFPFYVATAGNAQHKFISPFKVIKLSERWFDNKMKAVCEISKIEEDLFAEANAPTEVLDEFKELVLAMLNPDFEASNEGSFNNLRAKFIELL